MLKSAAGNLCHEIFGYRSILKAHTSALKLVANATSASCPETNKQNLPHLPVPELIDTLHKYLKSVRPHLTDDEFKSTTMLVKEFSVDGGVGYKLQKLLEQRASVNESWLADWWLHSAYLEFRWPVVVHSSPGLVFPLRRFRDTEDQLRYAAQTILAALDYKNLIDNDGIPLEKMGKFPLDMSQYKKIFGTCRIPGIKRDSLSFNDSRHITVMHKNHVFTVPMWDSDGVLLNMEQTIEQLREVCAASMQPAPAPLGVLTTEHRDSWGKAYHQLVKDPQNSANLKEIETSLFVLCLDEASGLWDLQDKSHRQTLAGAHTIHGNGSRANGNNRWFDKTVQFIVGADGVVGLTYEHSPAEGQPIAVLTDHIVNFIYQNKSEGRIGASSVTAPTRLDFNLSSELKNVISTAQQNLDKMVEDLQLNCFTYSHYGKEFIKSHKLSPDSYLQMAMQYAFYRLHNVPGAHYESAQTRMYAGGRTETIRSCSIESIAFAKSMLDTCASITDKVNALKAAVKAHKDYSSQAVQGLGVDRHLLGLKLIALEKGMEVPNLYQDKGFIKSAHMRISTSQVASKCDGFMCYGPLVADGYATCYNPRPDDINFATSAFRSHPDTNCDKYRTALQDALADMHCVLSQYSTKSKL